MRKPGSPVAALQSAARRDLHCAWAPAAPRLNLLVVPSLPAAASQSGLTSPLPGCVAWGGAKRRLQGVLGARRPPASALWKENWAPLTVNSATNRVTQLPLSPRPGVSDPTGEQPAESRAALCRPEDPVMRAWRRVGRHQRKPLRVQLFPLLSTSVQKFPNS